MSLSFLTPSRCVLLVGDDSLCIYNVSFSGAKLVDAIPWQTEGFEETVTNLIRSASKGKPVLIVNDMTDQHFKGGQRMPKVGLMDRMSVIQRKLQAAFPNYPIRGALAVKSPRKEKLSQGDKEAGGDQYLFAAVPMSEGISRTLTVARRSLAPLAGFCLLPVEAADMVTALAERLAGKSRPPSQWVVFIGQHHNGALRQVITRDGQLAMTRMTPLPDTEGDHEAWAREVFQEFKATISYLTRFGFSQQDSTDVIAVCHPAAGASFEELVDIPCHYTTFTAAEAARELGIRLGIQDEPRYADALHAVWIGRKTRFILPMKTEELSRIHQPRQVATLVILLSFLGTGYLSWQVMTQLQTMLQVRGDLGDQKDVLQKAEMERQQEQEKLQTLGFDINLMRSSIKTFNDLDSKRFKSLLFIEKIRGALGKDLRLDTLTFKYLQATQPPVQPGVPPPVDVNGVPIVEKPKFDASLRLSFPSTIEPEKGVVEINNLRRRLMTAMPKYDIVVEKNVAGLEYTDTLSGTAGESPVGVVSDKYVAEIRIRGNVE